MAFLYHTLAEQLISNIQTGVLSDGQRVPSIREMSRQRGLSITTVQKCYELLEAQGYLIAKAQSGFYVSAQTSSLKKPIFSGFEPYIGHVQNADLLDEISTSANDKNRVQFGTIQLSSDLIPTQLLTRSLVRATRSSPLQSTLYSPCEGELALRKAVCTHIRTDGIHFAPDELIITNGCMDALAHAIDAISQPGDTIAIPSPCFSGQLQLLASMKRSIMELPSTSEGIDLTQLEKAMRNPSVKACLLTACFQNPLGYNLSVDDKQKIAALARDTKCPVIEDDVFGECGYDKSRPLPLKSWDIDGYVIWCGSFSKTLAPGYRIGWCAPGRYYKEIRQHIRARNISVNAPLQLGLSDFVNSGEYRRHLDKLKFSLRKQVDSVYGSIIKHFGNNCRSILPKGGYALWIQLPKECDAFAIYCEAKTRGINLVPGHVFSSSGLYDSCIRLNAGNPWSDDLDQSVKKLADIIRHNQQT